ncbi:hypothetical protein [Kingella potus]|uniref:hypothetical protein n=1 Tax=Kingella potus TaxID=265175 RepID=UPI001FD0116E|nr:hypothetical protein [Kingella potus]UOP01521.1 hypothetical protein LVJ84_04835 [Kingella potus]
MRRSGGTPYPNSRIATAAPKQCRVCGTATHAFPPSRGRLKGAIRFSDGLMFS